MTSLTLSRVVICALFAGAILCLLSDQIRDPLLNSKASYSLTSFTPDKRKIDSETRTRLEQGYGKLPMRFEANKGQTDARVKFMARGAGYAVFLTGNETVLLLRKGKSGHEKQMADQPVESVVLRMKLAGSNPSSPVSGIEKLQTTSNYFIGNNPAAWRRGVSNYSKVKYESVYPGIDLVWYGNQQLLEHDFLVAAGADPSRIKFSFSGVDKMSIDDEGALVLRASGEDLRLLKPIAWQESNGSHRTVDCDYRLSDEGQVEFRLGDYNTELPLVIDPVLVYSTYIGGTFFDSGADIAVDSEGAAYITGQTGSTNFPGPSPIQPSIGQLNDAYVVKINPAGNAVVFGTWIGGNGTDSATGISIDQGGNVYLSGSTSSANFPLQNPLQASRRGTQDAFALKINSSGSMLIYSTYIGGTGADNTGAQAVDGSGNLYLTGSTDSGDFPVVNAFQTVKNGGGSFASDNRGASWFELDNGMGGADVNDLVIFPGDSSTIFAGTDRGVFKSIDRGLSWNLLGGTQFIRNITQIVVDPSTPDILYATSFNQISKSIDGGATWVPKPLTGVRTLAIDSASKLYAGTEAGLWVSTNGGDSWTSVFILPYPVESIAIDPITPSTIYIGLGQFVGQGQGIYKSVNGGTTWAFAFTGLPVFSPVRFIRIAISRSNPATLFTLADNGAIFKSTNSGGNWAQLIAPQFGVTQPGQSPLPLKVAPDNSEIVYAGSRSSGIFRSNDGGATWGTINNGLNAREIRAIVIDQNSPERVYAGADSATEAFVAKLDRTGSSIVYSSYLGGSGSESGLGIVVDSTGAAFIAGSTSSINFPVVNALQATNAGQTDAFIARVDEFGSALSWATYLGGTSIDSATGIALNTTGEVFVAGGTSSSNFPLNNALQSTLKGLQDGFVARLKNDGSALEFSSYLGGAGTDLATAITVDSEGIPYITGTTSSLDFPVIDAVQSSRAGNPLGSNFDAFVTKLSADGTAIGYSTYLGGSATDQGNGIAVDPAGNAYVTGSTFSFDFPITPFPIRPAAPGDGFVAKIGASTDLAITLIDAPDPVMINNQLTYSLIVTNNGPDPAISTIVTDTLAAGVSLVSSATSQGSCSGEREINCDLGKLARGERAEITIIVTPSGTGPITNSASVTSKTSDLNPANNSATIETRVSLIPSIYGRVSTAGGTGLGGISVALNGGVRPPVVTTDNGNYQFAELEQGGNYTVTPSRPGYVFNPPNRTISNLQSDQRADFQGVACIFSISSASQSFPATGGVGNVTITSPDPQCVWTAQSNVPWIKLISPSTSNATSNVSFKVEPTVGSRNGSLTIGGNRLIIFQEFNACESVNLNVTPVIALPQDEYGGRLLVKDFNQDSILDLVVDRYTLFGNRGLSFFPGTSDGKFGSPISALTIPSNQGSFSDLAADDFNNDGALDIVAISDNGLNTRNVWLILNNGMGEFAPPLKISTSEILRSVTTGDFNSDGKTDLVIAIIDQDIDRTIDALLYLNDGMGNFGPPQEIVLDAFFVGSPSKVRSVDLDHDGKLDLVIFRSTTDVTIYKGDGAGGFTVQPRLGIGFYSSGEIGDFNGDSFTDLLFSVSVSGGEELSLHLNDGAGNFGAPFRTPARVSFPAILAEDFNGDGKTDVVLRAFNEGIDSGIRLFTASSNGKFSEPIIFTPSIVASTMASGDFNRDGFADLISLNRTGSLTIAYTQGGGFNAPRGFDINPLNSFASQVSAKDIKSGDINGDGVLDLVLAANGVSNPVMMFGNGRGEFSPAVFIPTGVINAIPDAVELRDFNNDGKLDLAILSFNAQTVLVMLGNGQGQFTISGTISTGIIPLEFVSADFNKDGNFDLAVKAQSNGLALYLGNGQGGFTPSTTGIGGNIVLIRFTTGDFNGDGITDLALFDELPSPDNLKIIIMTGDGQGGFGELTNVRIMESLIYLRAADLNFDGRDDLIYTHSHSSTGNSVQVVLSNPGGGFAAPVRYQVGGITRSIEPKDINGDGKVDLISGSFDTGTISLLLNNGDGSFNVLNVPVFGAPARISAGDFDEDGRIDLAIARSGSSIVGILHNRAMCVPDGNVVPVSAASKFQYRVARNSIVTLQGENLATSTRASIPPFLPTTLANTRVKLTDSAGSERFAPLYSVSPNRITLLIPPQTSPGVALITVTKDGNVVAQGTASIGVTAPGLFSADLSGRGYAAALVLRIRADGSRDYQPVALFDFEQNRFVPVPIDVSNEAEQVFLLLSGTGIRNHSGLANVRAKVGGENAEVTFAGSQGLLPGVDQVDLRLLPALRGRGEVSVELLVDGRATNQVRIRIR